MPLLDLTTSTTTRLGLEPIKNPNGGYMFEGCIPTRVTDIHLTYQDHKKGEFKDKKVPVLQVEFENLKFNDPNQPDRFYTHSFKVVGTKELVAGTSDQYEERQATDVNADIQNLWKGIKHFLENLTHSPNYRNVLDIPKEDQIEYFDLPGSAPADERIAKWEKFFNYIIKFVNGDGEKLKSQIVDAEGKGLPMWIKMLPNYDKDPKRDKKFYAIPRFINQGVFEPLKLDSKGLPAGGPRIIRVKPTESLALTVTPTGIPGGTPGAGISQHTPGNIDPSVAALLK